MSRITAPKLHAQFAKAKECNLLIFCSKNLPLSAEGAFEQAATAYEMAKDLESVIRLNLSQLNNPEKVLATQYSVHLHYLGILIGAPH